MQPVAFFSAFAKALKANPPHAADTAMVRDLARLGLIPGREFDASGLTPETRCLRAGRSIGDGSY